ncbi:MAG: hypothetical protein KF774_21055 [Planctomyces sp.]|nr:hypothetical protein [Planctomyces sp.]
MSTIRKLGFAAFAVTAVAVLVAQAFAQSADRRFPGKPANPGASDLRSSYARSGRMGGGYRPYSAWSYQNNARVHAQSLYTYGRTVDKCDPATVREHVAEVKKNVAAAKKEVAALGDEAAKKADVKQHVDAMTKHYDEVEKMCKMIESSLDDNDVVCDCCKTIDDELAKAEGEHKKMLDTLGVHLPSPISEDPAAGEKK